MRALYTTPGEVREWEVSYVREQADLWRKLGAQTGTTRLAPACFMCAAGEDELVYLPADCALLCGNCGAKSSTTDLRAGRIVSR